jgi:predicted ATPase
MRSAIAAKRGLGVNPGTLSFGLACKHCLKLGPNRARDLLTEARKGCRQNAGGWFEAELHRLRAEALLASSPCDSAEAEASLRHALAVAREQEARFWELRDQGKRTAARDLLAPIYRCFTEGFETRDLKEAAALLAELAS